MNQTDCIKQEYESNLSLYDPCDQLTLDIVIEGKAVKFLLRPSRSRSLYLLPPLTDRFHVSVLRNAWTRLADTPPIIQETRVVSPHKQLSSVALITPVFTTWSVLDEHWGSLPLCVWYLKLYEGPGQCVILCIIVNFTVIVQLSDFNLTLGLLICFLKRRKGWCYYNSYGVTCFCLHS